MTRFVRQSSLVANDNASANQRSSAMSHHSVSKALDMTPVGESSSASLSRADSFSASTKRMTYKDRRKTYRIEKKKVAEELMSTLQDPTVVVMADWLKVRSTLKQWTKFWCELKPGLLLLNKSCKTHKSGNWVGTVIINVCEVIERPSKKNGFCFKLFHPLEHPIWAPKVRSDLSRPQTGGVTEIRARPQLRQTDIPHVLHLIFNL